MPVSCLSIRSLPHVNKVLNDDEKEGVSKKRTFFFLSKKGASLIAARPFSLLCPKWSLSVHVNVQLREWEVDSGLWQFFVETRIVVVENAPIVRSRHPNPDGQVDAACAQRTKRDKRRTICFWLDYSRFVACFIGIFIFFSFFRVFDGFDYFVVGI